ncbi:MAG: hypothetical protein MUP82_04575 [Candidatus Marinimicrobia bacterium]|nr:hypothetical protein [Candidatus Neomarinimicrobiota bacterium]
MKKILLPLLLISGFAFSQFSDLTQGLGFAAGMPSGTGFSYRQMNENYGFQVTMGALAYGYDDEYTLPEERIEYGYDGWNPNTNEIYTESSWNNDHFWGNIGLTYFKPLHRAEKSLFYGFAGVSAYYTTEKYVERDYKYFQETDSAYIYKPIGAEKELRETDLDMFIGVGLGISYNITENIRFSLELPFTVSDQGHIWMIVPQGGLHYYFK